MVKTPRRAGRRLALGPGTMGPRGVLDARCTGRVAGTGVNVSYGLNLDANIVRRELKLPEVNIPAADPRYTFSG